MIDCHCHVTAVDSQGVQQLVDGGISMICLMSCQMSDWEAVSRCALAHPSFIIPAFGIHPWFAEAAPQRQVICAGLDAMRQRHANRIIIGEVGLDFCKARLTGGEAQRQAQLQTLQIFLDYAVLHNLPLSMHCVKAHEMLLGLIASQKLLFHSYSGNLQDTRRFISLPGSRQRFLFCFSEVVNGRSLKASILTELAQAQIAIESDEAAVAAIVPGMKAIASRLAAATASSWQPPTSKQEFLYFLFN